MKTFKYIIATGIVLIGLNTKAQTSSSFSYSQYMDNLTPVNPTYSLLENSGSLTGVVRKQYVGVNGSPTTFLLNGSMPISSIGASAGFALQNDQLAIETQTQFNAFFAKSIHMSETSFLAVSLNAGIRNYKANYTQIANIDPNDPTFSNNITQTKPNLGFGVMLYSDKYYVGVSLPELSIHSLGTGDVQDNNNFRNHYYFAGAYLFDLADDLKLKPATLVAYSRGEPTTADISGTFYMKNMLGIGANYRTTGELAGILSFNVNAIHIGYSYQFGTNSSNLGGFNNATHELSVTLRFGKGSTTPKLL